MVDFSISCEGLVNSVQERVQKKTSQLADVIQERSRDSANLGGSKEILSSTGPPKPS